MKFFLLQQQPVTFPSSCDIVILNGYSNQHTKTIRIQSNVVKGDNCCEIVKNFCEKLKSSENHIDFGLELTLDGFSDYANSFGRHSNGSLSVQLRCNNLRLLPILDSQEIPILLKIQREFPQTKIKISITDFKSSTNQLVSQKVYFDSLSINQRGVVRSVNPFLMQSSANRSNLLYSGNSFTGNLTISVKLPEHECEKTQPRNPTRSIPQQLSVCKKILEEGLASDVVITAGNGAKIKAHKNFLSAQSSVLKTMFESGMSESKSGEVDMADMSEEAVKAFLLYLYCWDTTAPMKSCLVAFELYRAGHKYDVPSLEELMKDILLGMGSEEYTVDVGLQLFCFVRCVEDAEELKLKAVKVLKSKFDDLMGCSRYQTLFKKHPEAAMELCKCFAQVKD